MVAVVDIVSKRGLTIDVCCTSQPNNSRLALYKLLIHISTRQYTSVIKVCMVCVGTIYVSSLAAQTAFFLLYWGGEKRVWSNDQY